jgi:hypothetical protein
MVAVAPQIFDRDISVGKFSPNKIFYFLRRHSHDASLTFKSNVGCGPWLCKSRSEKKIRAGALCHSA